MELLAGHERIRREVVDTPLDLDVVPMDPDMADALADFHRRLSPETRRRRFFSPHAELSAAEVERFTHVDHLEREALVAFDDDRIVAVARLDRLAPGAPVAEVAFVVADDHQHHGIGTAMFQLLSARARELGIHRFVADTLAENRPMQQVFAHSGFPCVRSMESGLVHVVLRLDGASASAARPQTVGGPVSPSR